MATIKKIATKKASETQNTLEETNIINMGQIKEPVWYPIDWEKVKTIEDIKVILENMGLGCYDNAPAYEVLKKYVFSRYDKIIK
jgi:hypothetical protein